MSRTDWPRLCTIAEASRLFEGEGVTVHRSNLSRYIDSRKIEKVDGKIDPTTLFDAYARDYGRKIMSGEASRPVVRPQPAAAPLFQPPQSPAAPADADPSDPSRELKELQARSLRLQLAEREGRTLAAEEVAATLANALATMRATFLQTAREEAGRLLAEFEQPGHRQPQAVAALKRYADRAQEAWAAIAAKLLDASTPAGMAARQRLDALVALDLDLRGLAEPETPGETAATDPQA